MWLIFLHLPCITFNHGYSQSLILVNNLYASIYPSDLLIYAIAVDSPKATKRPRSDVDMHPNQVSDDPAFSTRRYLNTVSYNDEEESRLSSHLA